MYEDFQNKFQESINEALSKLYASKMIEVADEDFEPDRRNPK